MRLVRVTGECGGERRVGLTPLPGLLQIAAHLLLPGLATCQACRVRLTAGLANPLSPSLPARWEGRHQMHLDAFRIKV